MGMPIFVIGERKVAEELLNVRGGISAGRPSNVLVQELCVAPRTHRRAIDKISRMGWAEWSIVMMQPGKILSERRFHSRKATTRDAIGSYRPLIEAGNRLFLKNAIRLAGDPSPLVNR
jgi:hypothetical protein